MKQRPKLKTDRHNYDMLGYNKHSDSSDDERSMELLPKRFQTPQQFIEAEVQDGDTLQAIALRFNCSVSKLMRVNNILRENEIHAKKMLRIPVCAYSLLTETIPMVHTSGANSPTRHKAKEIPPDAPPIVNSEEFQEKIIIATVNASQTVPIVNNVNHIVNTEPIIENETFDTETPLLAETRPNKTGVEAIFINEICSKGDNMGFRLCPLLIFIIIICLVIPFLYIEYVKEHPEKFHHKVHP